MKNRSASRFPEMLECKYLGSQISNRLDDRTD